jgi:SAM-dependent methyltransferase
MLSNDAMRRSTTKADQLVLRGLLRLPPTLRWRLIHRHRRSLLHTYLERMLGPVFRPVDPGPAAPPELTAETSGLTESDLVPRQTHRDEYFAGAYLGTLHLLRTAERCGFNIRTASAILDFGCGSAKMLRLLRCIDGIRLFGADVNPRQIEWARRHAVGIEFVLNDLEPPLPGVDADSFDLVTAASVFTHIPLDLQDRWLGEVRRVLRADGFFICTVAGSAHIARQLTPEGRAQLAAHGEVTLTASDAGASAATAVVGSWDVFQTRRRVIDAFRRHFAVVDFLADPQGQDVVIGRKRAPTGTDGSLESAAELGARVRASSSGRGRSPGP